MGPGRDDDVIALCIAQYQSVDLRGTIPEHSQVLKPDGSRSHHPAGQVGQQSLHPPNFDDPRQREQQDEEAGQTAKRRDEQPAHPAAPRLRNVLR